jgi:hypothetical protein
VRFGPLILESMDMNKTSADEQMVSDQYQHLSVLQPGAVIGFVSIQSNKPLPRVVTETR